MAEKIRIPVTGSQSVAAVYARPTDPQTDENYRTLVIMVHDLPGSHKDDDDGFLELIETSLTGSGLHTLRFDFRGCGESDGQAEHTSLGSASRDLDAVFEWATKTGYHHFLLLAQGLGSAVALTHMAENVKAAVLLWPWLDPREITHIHFGENHGPSRLFLEAGKTNLRPFMKKIRTPVLILMGEQDEIVPQEQLQIARKFIPSKRLEINTYHGGKKGFPEPSHRKNAANQIHEFIRKNA